MRVITFCLLACLGINAHAAGNPTVYPYKIDASIVDNPDFDTVIIATHNLGKPTTSYLAKKEDKIDDFVREYLKKKKINVIPSDDYAFALSTAESEFGDPFDPSTGRLDMAKKTAILARVVQLLKESRPEIDGIVFTDLIEREVYFSTGLKRVARWDGVSRRPLMQGPGSGVPVDFNWARPVDAASLAVYIFTLDGVRVFHSIGGLSLTEAIETKGSNARFKRHKNLLNSKSQIKEGVELAFHPWIPMKKYPAPKEKK